MKKDQKDKRTNVKGITIKNYNEKIKKNAWKYTKKIKMIKVLKIYQYKKKMTKLKNLLKKKLSQKKKRKAKGSKK